MAKVTARERKLAQNQRIYGEKVGRTREKLFYNPYNKLADAIEKDFSKADDPESILKSIDKNIEKVFEPLIQKSLFDCWRLNIDQFTDYFVEVWGRNISIDKIQPIKSKLLNTFLEKYSAQKVTSISDTTRNIMKNRIKSYTKQGLSHRDMVKALVKDTKGEISKARAELIAREETSQALAATNHKTAQEGKLGFKKWIYRGGAKVPRVNHQAIDGQKVRINQLFKVPGHGKVPATNMRFPKDPENGVAGQIINCYCGVIYTRK